MGYYLGSSQAMQWVSNAQFICSTKINDNFLSIAQELVYEMKIRQFEAFIL